METILDCKSMSAVVLEDMSSVLAETVWEMVWWPFHLIGHTICFALSSRTLWRWRSNTPLLHRPRWCHMWGENAQLCAVVLLISVEQWIYSSSDFVSENSRRRKMWHNKLRHIFLKSPVIKCIMLIQDVLNFMLCFVTISKRIKWRR